MKIARTLIPLFIAAAALAQAPGEDRVEAYVRAFNSGSPEQMETFAQANMTAEALKRRNADERRAMYEQLWSAHGKLTIVNVDETNDGLRVEVKPERGETMQLRFGIEPAPPHRIAGLGIAIGGRGREDGPPLPPLQLPETDYAAALDAYIRKLPGFSGAVLVAKNGEVQFEKAYGAGNQTSTAFNVGSITKAFTKVAIGRLAQAGKLKLDAPILTYLPNYPNQEVAQKITVQQLVDHTSGLGDIFTRRYFDSGQQLRSVQSYVDFFASDPLQFEPGKGRRYSNYGYIVLGAIIEAVSGAEYAESIRKNVFGPAGMSSSNFNGPRSSPAGGTLSTVRDLLAFDRAARAGKLLDEPRTRWFFRGDPQAAWNAAGGAPGINAVIASDAASTVVVLTNIDPPAGEKLGEAIFEALR